MKKTRCYSVRLRSLRSISDKCLLATDWQGNEVFIPKSQFFGDDYSVIKSEAYWIASWIIDKSSLIVSSKKVGWYNPTKATIEPEVTTIVEKITPTSIEASIVEPDKFLMK